MNTINLNSFLIERQKYDHLHNLSVDCVIFGFHDGVLKILLNKLHTHNKWMLPGGGIRTEEDVDVAASRILKERTGLDKVYLKQFYLFGDKNRTNIEENKQLLLKNRIKTEDAVWFLQRHASLAYYAFVDHQSTKVPNQPHEEINWFEIEEIPYLYSDHNQIINKAIITIREQVKTIPFGLELLPEKFTASELRTIYETILSRKLDRRNFQKKMLSTGLVDKLEEVSRKKGTKNTTLFAFNKEKYMKALKGNEDMVSIV